MNFCLKVISALISTEILCWREQLLHISGWLDSLVCCTSLFSSAFSSLSTPLYRPETFLFNANHNTLLDICTPVINSKNNWKPHLNLHLLSLSLKAVMDGTDRFIHNMLSFTSLNCSFISLPEVIALWQTHVNPVASVVCSLADLTAVIHFCNSCNVTSAGRWGRHLRKGM